MTRRTTRTRLSQLLLVLMLLIGTGYLLARVEAQEQTATPVASLIETLIPTSTANYVSWAFTNLTWQPIKREPLLAVATYNEVHLYTADLRLVGRLQGHTANRYGRQNFVYAVDFNPGGTILASGGTDGTVRLWDVATRRMITTISDLPGEVWKVRWSSDGQRLAIVAWDHVRNSEINACCTFDPFGQVSIWNVSDLSKPVLEQQMITTNGVTDDIDFVGIRNVSWSIDNSYLIVGNSLSDYESDFFVYDVKTGELITKSIFGGFGLLEVNDFVRRPTSNMLAVAGSFNVEVTLYDPIRDWHWMELSRSTERTGNARGVAWDPQGRYLAAGSSENVINIWDTVTARRVLQLEEPGQVGDVVWSSDGVHVAAISGENVLHIWDVSHLPDVRALPTATYDPMRNRDWTPLPLVRPIVTVEQGYKQSDPTNAATVTFKVQFSVPVFGFDASDVDLRGSTAPGTLTASVTGSDDIYLVRVTGMTGSGTVVARIPANAVYGSGNLGNFASSGSDNQVTFQKAT